LREGPDFQRIPTTKNSKELHARPDQIHPDRRAARREAVEVNACFTVILTYSNPNWIKQRMLGTAEIFGEQRRASASK